MSTKYSFFVHMQATKAWLSLSREERSDYFRVEIGVILARYSSVNLRLFDAEAFSAKCSDIAFFETEVIEDYYFLMDALRDSKIFTVGYFNIVDIFATIEGGFVKYDAHLLASKASA